MRNLFFDVGKALTEIAHNALWSKSEHRILLVEGGSKLTPAIRDLRLRPVLLKRFEQRCSTQVARFEMQTEWTLQSTLLGQSELAIQIKGKQLSE